MKLYLLRHGHSPSALEAKVATDAERPLSDRGRQAVAANVARLQRKGGKPELILHSPLRRAAETAREAARLLQPPLGVKEFPPLDNSLPPQELARRLAAPDCRAPELLLVGHQPQLGELAAVLCGQLLELRPGGIVALDGVENGRAKLLWAANPDDPA